MAKSVHAPVNLYLEGGKEQTEKGLTAVKLSSHVSDSLGMRCSSNRGNAIPHGRRLFNETTDFAFHDS